MPKKLTHEEYVNRVKKRNPNIEILSEYKGKNKNITKKCLVCGTISEVQAGTLLVSNGCVTCGIEKVRKANLRSEEEVIKEIHDFNPNVEILSEYTGVDNKIKCRCKIHNIEYESTPYVLKKHISCPECIRIMRGERTDEEFKEELRRRYPTIQSISKYNGIGKPTKFRCMVCDYEWTAQPNRLLNVNKDKCGCPRCKKKHYKVTEEDYIKRISETSPNTEYVGGFTHVNGRVIVKCKTCGYEWETSAWTILNGSGCPKCKMSRGEVKIAYYLDNHEIEYKAQYIFNDCRNKSVLRFDFYIPSYNCCIEYDGIQHFKYCTFGAKNRTAEQLSIIQERDKVKDNYCLEKGIKIIRIPYTDFNNIEIILDKYFSQKNWKRIFGIAGKIGQLDQRGTVHTYQDYDNNAERVHIMLKDYQYTYVISDIDRVAKITFSA